MNRWWDQNSEERFWLEITDRNDIGADLNAPQRGDNDQHIWSYSLINEVASGDVIFHYHKPQSAIIAWSISAGSTWEDVVVWGAHGTAARESGVEPYPRPGWRLGLEQFTTLGDPVGLSDLRQAEGDVRLVLADLQSQHQGSIYFPFAVSDKRPLRPTQGYLTKFPAALVAMFPQLHSALSDGDADAPPRADVEPGAPYRPANEGTAISQHDPFTVDPALVERAVRGHAKTQNRLAAVLLAHGLTPRSPRNGEPNFDLLWKQNGELVVAEIKSVSDSNEEKQLRLGLGQVLRYRHLLSAGGDITRAVLALEREPADASWLILCQELGVRLLWPEVFEEVVGSR